MQSVVQFWSLFHCLLISSGVNGGRASVPDAIISNSGPVSASGHSLDSKSLHTATRRRRQGRLATAYALSTNDIQFVVDEHNRYRRLVPATDMRMISWDSNLAASAQGHANQCVFAHSTNRVNVGENIYANRFPTFNGAVRMWFDEGYNNYCGCTNYYKHCCGHYTQVAWASTSRIGCGYSNCNSILNAPGHRYIFVCHYSPAGNILGRGGFTYKSEGQNACNGCATGYTCDNGLCRW